MERVRSERGYAMAALIVLMSVMAVAMTAALPVWSTTAKREKEAELVFRGEQYAHAIALFQRKYPGAYPPNLDALVNEHVLRKKYKDPVTGGDFAIVSVGDPAAMEAQAIASAGRGGQAAAAAAASAARGAGAQSSTTTSSRDTTTSGGNTNSRAQTGSTTGTGTATSRGTGPGAVGSAAGVMGVRSRSEEKSLRIYNGKEHYNEWLFVATAASTSAGGGSQGEQTPGQGVRGGQAPGTPRGAGPRGGQPSGTPRGNVRSGGL